MFKVGLRSWYHLLYAPEFNNHETGWWEWGNRPYNIYYLAMSVALSFRSTLHSSNSEYIRNTWPLPPFGSGRVNDNVLAHSYNWQLSTASSGNIYIFLWHCFIGLLLRSPNDSMLEIIIDLISWQYLTMDKACLWLMGYSLQLPRPSKVLSCPEKCSPLHCHFRSKLNQHYGLQITKYLQNRPCNKWQSSKGSSPS